MKMKAAVASAALALAGVVSAAPVDLSKLPPPSTQQGLTYEKDIHPLFEASCVHCHSGPRPRGGLRLDTREGVLKGSKDGKVLVPGDSEKSKLVIAVAQLDPDSAMPPKPHPHRRRGPGGESSSESATNAPNSRPGPGEGAPNPRRPKGPPPKPLTAEQVGLVRAWIDQGAN